jgi:hypothetical protein
MQRIIGLAGKARSGKDTVAQILGDLYGYHTTAFAESLKRACGEIFHFNAAQLYGDLKEEVDPFWQMTPRHVMQHVGTELFRHWRSEIWVQSCARRIAMEPTVNWVIVDVRFPNEADAVRRWGGKVVWIERPGRPTLNDAVACHASETALDRYDGFDAALINDRTIDDLIAEVEGLF